MLNRFAAPVDYLVIGHLVADLLPDGSHTLGGTAAYAALTAHALGLKPGILTAVGPEMSLEPLEAVPVAGIECEASTTFENRSMPSGRRQRVLNIAPPIRPHMLPQVWRKPAIVHFAPVMQEIDFDLLRLFPGSFIGVTPQGWLRSAGRKGRIFTTDWLESSYVLGLADAAVLSLEDVGGDEGLIEQLADSTDLLVVTEAEAGCRLYRSGYATTYRAPEEALVDSTGAGDIFAAVFFTVLQRSADPVTAVEVALQLASASVRRRYLDSIPTGDEIYQTTLDYPNTQRITNPL